MAALYKGVIVAGVLSALAIAGTISVMLGFDVALPMVGGVTEIVPAIASAESTPATMTPL